MRSEASLEAPGGSFEARRWSSGRTSATVPRAYADAFAAVQEHLHAGNSYEVNLTYRLDAESELDPVAAYLRLRELNPAPYAGFLQHDVEGARGWLLSSSPERYALVTRDEEDGTRTIETKPIKGTTPRGATPEEDDGAAGPSWPPSRGSAPRT